MATGDGAAALPDPNDELEDIEQEEITLEANSDYAFVNKDADEVDVVAEAEEEDDGDDDDDDDDDGVISELDNDVAAMLAANRRKREEKERKHQEELRMKFLAAAKAKQEELDKELAIIAEEKRCVE